MGNFVESKQRFVTGGALPMLALMLSATFLTVLSTAQPVRAAEVLEEIIVTAQRTEESLQEVPIAVTALSGEMLEDKGIINPSDLQLAAPNVSFTATNFGNSSFSIRGIGRLVISASGEAGVSTHLDEIPVTTNLNAVEFFDVERVEVLRGPQGTLFGRNATGGSINMVTRKPDYDAIDGFIDAEVGDYSNIRVKGAINIPFGDTAGIRIAGFKLERDGYIENTAHGMQNVNAGAANVGAGCAEPPCQDEYLRGINDDIDGRDIVAARATISWDFTDNGNVWLQYNYFDEDDDRARLTNQVCKRTALPALGCEPNEVGFDAPHASSTTGNIFFALNNPLGGPGSLPLGAAGIDGEDGISYAFPQPEGNGLRTVHTDFEPVYQFEEELITVGAEYDFGFMTLSFLGAYQETEFVSQVDYNVDVGPTVAPPSPTQLFISPALAAFEGRWPTSAPAGGPGGDVTGNVCNYNMGTAGVFGGCIIDNDGTRYFAMDSATADTEYSTGELRLASAFDGAFNFQIGISAYAGERFGDYYVNNNGLDSVGFVGAAGVGFPPLYPTMFNVPGNPNNPTSQSGQAIYWELYYDISERLTLTFGLRYNEDEKKPNDRNAFLASANQRVIFDTAFLDGVRAGAAAAQGLPPGSLTAENFPAATAIAAAIGCNQLDPNWETNLDSLTRGWGRLSLASVLTGTQTDAELAILRFNGISEERISALMITLPYSLARVEAVRDAGLIAGYNEVRTLTNSPSEEEWTAVTGRLGVDFKVTDEVLLYGFFSRGYKPGGFNPPIGAEFQSTSSFTFDEEKVDSIEVGFKSTLMDGTLVLNGTAFVYDYEGLQVTRIRNNSSLNENIDADIMGAELEWVWRPEDIENFALDGSFSWLDTELASGTTSVDVINKPAGNPDWIELKDIGPGARAGVNFIAHLPTLLANDMEKINEAIAANRAFNIPGTIYDNGVPSLFSGSWLAANEVAISAGNPINIGGNSLPNAPEYTFRLGAQYTWPLASAGNLTLRWDFYWQDDSYGREFNTKGDQIESWDQHNMSLIFESANDDWQVKGFIRNLQDSDNVTGHYLTSDTSGFFRNYFLTEPRIYGLSVRYGFGG